MKFDDFVRGLKDAQEFIARGYPAHAENVVLRLAEAIRADRDAEWAAKLEGMRAREREYARDLMRLAGRHAAPVEVPPVFDVSPCEDALPAVG